MSDFRFIGAREDDWWKSMPLVCPGCDAVARLTLEGIESQQQRQGRECSECCRVSAGNDWLARNLHRLKTVCDLLAQPGMA